MHVLKRYSIENYFSLDTIRRVFGSQVPVEVKKISPKTKIETQLGFNIKKSNRKIAEAMVISEIKGTDLKAFLDTVAKECEETSS